MKDKSNLDILAELTQKLPPFPSQLGEIHPGHWQEYRMIKGKSKARNILSIPGRISIAQWWNSKGSEFPEHAHEQREFLLVIEGRLDLFVEGEEVVMKAGDCRYIAPGMRHNGYYPEDTDFIAITVPDSDDWPD